MEGIIMAKKLGKLFTLAVTAGTAAAAALPAVRTVSAAGCAFCPGRGAPEAGASAPGPGVDRAL